MDRSRNIKQNRDAFAGKAQIAKHITFCLSFSLFAAASGASTGATVVALDGCSTCIKSAVLLVDLMYKGGGHKSVFSLEKSIHD